MIWLNNIKLLNMKNPGIIFLSVITIGFFLSCSKEGATVNGEIISCKQCKIMVTNNSTHVVSYYSSEEKCGLDLINAENALPVTVGDETTQWVCE